MCRAAKNPIERGSEIWRLAYSVHQGGKRRVQKLPSGEEQARLRFFQMLLAGQRPGGRADARVHGGSDSRQLSAAGSEDR